jgi:hypothetical protein
MRAKNFSANSPLYRFSSSLTRPARGEEWANRALYLGCTWREELGL